MIWIRPGVPFEASEVRVDKDGRWVMLKGRLNRQEVTLGSVYAPNQGQLDFLRQLSPILKEVSTDKMIIGGDFNCVLDV